MAERDLWSRGVAPELLSPLRALPGDEDARIIARVASVVLARTRIVPSIENPLAAPSLLKVAYVLARELRADELESVTRAISPDLLTLDSSASGPPDLVRDLVVQCAERGSLHRLLDASLHVHPDRILEITRELAMFPWTDDADGLGRYLDSLSSHDRRSWGYACWGIASCVCEVRVDGRATGTGFLIGPDAVLTSYRVVIDCVARAADASTRLAFIFDRIPMLGGVNPGVSVAAADRAWLIATSPPAPGELPGTGAGPRREPIEDELDFALIRTASPIGTRRSWRALRLHTDGRVAGSERLAIPHHPERHSGHSALALALSDPAEYKHTMRRTRVRYRIDASRGSSGAPVFDATSWQLLALHLGRARDGRQQGTPIARIARHPAVQHYLASQPG
jgi:hypothetical protein